MPSIAWKHFEKYADPISGERRSKCKLCDYDKPFTGTTTNMIRHLKSLHTDQFIEVECQLEPKTRNSVVWSFFNKNSDETLSDDIQLIFCNICGHASQFQKSTTNLLRHLKREHPSEFAEAKIKRFMKKGLIVLDHEMPEKTSVAEPREPRPVRAGKIALKRKKILYYERLRMLQARRKLKAGNDTAATIDPEQIIYNEPVKLEPDDQALAPDSPKEPIKNDIEKKYADNDEDLLYAMSLVPFLKRVNENNKIDARIEIFQVLRRFTTKPSVQSVNQYQTPMMQYSSAPPSFHQSPMPHAAVDPSVQDRTYQRIGNEMNVVILDESNPSDILDLGSVKCE